MILSQQKIESTNPRFHNMEHYLIDQPLLNNDNYKFITIPNKELKMMLYYPPGCDKNSTKKCILVHNQSNVSVKSYFDIDSSISLSNEYLIYYLAQNEKTNCPILFYDYQNTGINQSLPPSTANSLIDNSYDALKYATESYDSVISTGSSLGGTLAVKSLSKLMKKHKELSEKVTDSYIHDGITSIAERVMPNHSLIASFLTRVLGANIDIKSDLKEIGPIISKKNNIYILSNNSDDEIPNIAKPSEYIKKLKNTPIVIHESTNKSFNHTGISPSMEEFLEQKYN